MCRQCYQVLDIIDKLEVQLKLKKGEVQNLYFNSGKPFQDAMCMSLTKDIDEKAKIPPELPSSKSSVVSRDFVNQLPNLETNQNEALTVEIVEAVETVEVDEPPKKKDKGLLTSTDLKCQVCSKTFEKRRYLMDHLRRVHNSAVHQCAGCNIRFKYKEEAVTHQNMCQPFTQLR